MISINKANEKDLGIVSEYLIAVDASGISTFDKVRTLVSVSATKYDDHFKPIVWAVYDGTHCCLNRRTKKFDYEPLPSDRTETYFRNHRFSTAQEAIAFFRKHFSKGYVFIEA